MFKIKSTFWAIGNSFGEHHTYWTFHKDCLALCFCSISLDYHCRETTNPAVLPHTNSDLCLVSWDKMVYFLVPFWATTLLVQGHAALIHVIDHFVIWCNISCHDCFSLRNDKGITFSEANCWPSFNLPPFPFKHLFFFFLWTACAYTLNYD